MPRPFETNQFRNLFDERLKAIFSGNTPLITLDDRNEFYLQLLWDHGALSPGMELIDLGAGISVFGPICAAAGMKVSMVDDFGGGGGVELGGDSTQIPLLDVFEKQLGIQIVRQNFLEEPLPFADGSIQAVTCFHSLEHWHQSPKPLFREIVRVLRPGGVAIFATPNAANLRKRIAVLFGKSNYATLEEWYHEGDPVYRGHVREPILRDLTRLMEWNGLEVAATAGRNFIGRKSEALKSLPAPLVDFTSSISERLLKFFPTLCSDLHVVGRKR